MARELQSLVLDIRSDPPTSPGFKDRYIIGPNPTGDWSGKANYLAESRGPIWLTTFPQIGWFAVVRDESATYEFDGASWVIISAGTGGGGVKLTTDAPEDSTFVTAEAGTAGEAARADHKHDLGTPPDPVNVDGALAKVGISIIPARADHKHDISAGEVPTEISDVGVNTGSSDGLARGDHVHPHGSRGGGTLHADAVAGSPGSSGFMTSPQVSKLAAIADGADVTPALDDALHGSRGGAGLHAEATTAIAGFMSAQDKTDLTAASGTLIKLTQTISWNDITVVGSPVQNFPFPDGQLPYGAIVLGGGIDLTELFTTATGGTTFSIEMGTEQFFDALMAQPVGQDLAHYSRSGLDRNLPASPVPFQASVSSFGFGASNLDQLVSGEAFVYVIYILL